jgi:uncharacterized membrane protein YqaE (UPF0057 family)
MTTPQFRAVTCCPFKVSQLMPAANLFQFPANQTAPTSQTPESLQRALDAAMATGSAVRLDLRSPELNQFIMVLYAFVLPPLAVSWKPPVWAGKAAAAGAALLPAAALARRCCGRPESTAQKNSKATLHALAVPPPPAGRHSARNYGDISTTSPSAPCFVIDFHFWLSVVLTLLAWLPGVLHALWVVLGPADEADLEAGGGPLARPLLWGRRG